MELFDIKNNDDGTYTARYTTTIKDVNGADFSVIVNTVTRSATDLQQEIDNVDAKVTAFLDQRATLQAELDAVNNL